MAVVANLGELEPDVGSSMKTWSETVSCQPHKSEVAHLFVGREARQGAHASSRVKQSQCPASEDGRPVQVGLEASKCVAAYRPFQRALHFNPSACSWDSTPGSEERRNGWPTGAAMWLHVQCLRGTARLLIFSRRAQV